MTHHATSSTIPVRATFPFRIWCALAALCLTLPVMAATPLDETRALDLEGNVTVSTNLNGTIEIRVWDRPEVHLTGALADGVETLSITDGGRHLEVIIKYPDNTGFSWFGLFSFRNGLSSRAAPSQLQLTLPRTASVELKSVSADIDVAGVAGSRLAINSVSGDIVAVGAPREAEVENVSGKIRLELDGSREVEAESVSGNVHIRGHLSGKLTLESVSGAFEIDTRGGAVERLNLSTVSGDSRIHTDLAPGGRIAASSISGDIDLITPDNLSARVKGESLSGHIRMPTVNTNQSGINRSVEQRYGGGDGDIRLESLSGNIELKLDAVSASEIST